MADVCAIVLAAGDARRMGKNKMQLVIGGKTVLERTLLAFEQSGCITRAVIVCKRADEPFTKQAASRTLSIPFVLVSGGSERQFSVQNALMAAQGADIVAVHDGARCFVSPALIRACVEKAQQTGAAAAGVRTRDTMKVLQDNQVTGTIERDRLVNIQTPQVSRLALLQKAHEQAHADGYLGTDECSLLERIGAAVSFVEADGYNMKITTPEDVMFARFIAGQQTRTGHGYDAHRFTKERPLIIGGVHIPHTHGLLGHSDADVLCHAIIDALLGAAAAGDIGTHFPCTQEFAGISSLLLLERTRAILDDRGCLIISIDATVVMERPKLAPYIGQMRENIANALGLECSAVSVKATTTEGMGFEGTKQGASAHAVATLLG